MVYKKVIPVEQDYGARLDIKKLLDQDHALDKENCLSPEDVIVLIFKADASDQQGFAHDVAMRLQRS